MSKKYRLLKDLPGCPEGTVFTRLNDGPFPPVHAGEVMYGPEGADSDESDIHVPQSAIKDSDWFAPLPDEQEAPYPWTPKEGDSLWIADATIETPDYIMRCGYTVAGDDRAIRRGNAYRTEEDAELRLSVEPLVNRAVQAVLNARSTKSTSHCHVLWTGRPYKFFVGADFATPNCRGIALNSENDAQAVADLFNWFLTNTPHE